MKKFTILGFFLLKNSIPEFIEIMDKIAQIDEIVQNNKDFTSITNLPKLNSP